MRGVLKALFLKVPPEVRSSRVTVPSHSHKRNISYLRMGRNQLISLIGPKASRCFGQGQAIAPGKCAPQQLSSIQKLTEISPSVRRL